MVGHSVRGEVLMMGYTDSEEVLMVGHSVQ